MFKVNHFDLDRVLTGAFDDVSCVAWTGCSRLVAAGSKDNTVRIYALRKFSNFGKADAYRVGGHSDAIVRVFFEKGSLDLYTVSRDGHLLVWRCSLALDALEPVQDKACKSTIAF